MENRPNILAIETSSRAGSVAVARGPDLLSAATFRTDHNHASELLPTVGRLCADQGWNPRDIEDLYLSIGPGSFTGLRIAVTFARTLARFRGVRIIAVPTLTVLAHNALDIAKPPSALGVILDAKRGQVYAGAFELSNGRYVERVAPTVCSPAGFVVGLPAPRAILGEGIPYHDGALADIDHQALPESMWRPRAEWVHRLGWGLAQDGRHAPGEGLTPLYLRIPEAEEVWNRRQGRT